MKNIIAVLACLVFSSGVLAADNPQVRIDTNMGSIELELDPVRAPKTVENFLRYVNEGFYNGTIFHRVIRGFMIQGGGFTQGFDKKPTHAPVANEAFNGLKNDRGTVAMAAKVIESSTPYRSMRRTMSARCWAWRSCATQTAAHTNGRGTIAMARTNMPHSATAQFFINTVNNDFLNFQNKSMRGWGYAVFGKVTKGMDVVDRIEAVKTGAGGIFPQDVPQPMVVIKKVEVITPAAAE